MFVHLCKQSKLLPLCIVDNRRILWLWPLGRGGELPFAYHPIFLCCCRVCVVVVGGTPHRLCTTLVLWSVPLNWWNPLHKQWEPNTLGLQFVGTATGPCFSFSLLFLDSISEFTFIPLLIITGCSILGGSCRAYNKKFLPKTVFC